MISSIDALKCYYNNTMKEKTPLELEKENRNLQTRWNSLKEWLKENQRDDNPNNDEYYGADILDKMDELEGDNNETDNM